MSAATTEQVVDNYDLALACLKHAGAEHVRGDLCAVLLAKAQVHALLSISDLIRETLR
jgi:hypothetical protein